MRLNILLCLLVAGVALGLPFGSVVRAQQSLADTSTPATSSSQADQLASQINQLKQEIAQLQGQLDTTTEKKQTLQNAIDALNLNIRKITTSVNLTNAQIRQADQQIATLSTNISTTSDAMGVAQGGIADTLRQLERLDQEPIALVLLGGGTLSSVFAQEDELAAVRADLQDRTATLSDLKVNLTASKTASQQKRDRLAALESDLTQQKQSLSIAKQSQSELLTQTKNQESNYQQLIAQKKSQEADFEQQLLNLGSQIHTTGPYNLPAPGPILSWPVDNTKITQYFGNTAFATKNPQIYSGHGHDGIDLRASPGTPVHAALTGVVVGTGNTDIACPGASFGKWVFIQHANGLSTMYAHLATILVSKGQSVKTGQLIAYSDTTGYAIGPHLHFGVYATAGTVIKTWATSNPRPECYGKLWTMPVAKLDAYLNPLSYLPPLPK